MDEFDQKMEISEQPQEEIVEKIPGRDVYETVSSLVSALLVVVLVFTFLVRLSSTSTQQEPSQAREAVNCQPAFSQRG